MISELEEDYVCKSKILNLDEIPTWKDIAAEKCLNMSPEERKTCCNSKSVTVYSYGEMVPLDQIPTRKDIAIEYEKNDKLNEKVSIFRGDICTLVVDAIVNATDGSMSGSGGVDRAIHRHAGCLLSNECRTLGGRLTIGEAKITEGYKLPAKYVIHTVGPFGGGGAAAGIYSKQLKDCYINSLTVAQEFGLRSIAFPCISTGTFRYPEYDAAHVALRAVRNFLEKNESSIDRVVFCLFTPHDVEIYEALLKIYFPY